MPQPDRKMTREAIIAREAEVIRRRAAGDTFQTIGTAMGVTEAMIRRIASRVNKRTLKAMEKTVQEMKAEMADRLDEHYSLLRAAWVRSTEAAQKVMERTQSNTVSAAEQQPGEGAQTTDRHTERRETLREVAGQVGDPSYLEEARQTLRDMAKLFGLDAPVKTEEVGKGAGVHIHVEEVIRATRVKPEGEST